MAIPVPFGRYELHQKIAMGGMAELFLARAKGAAGFQKTCVIKRVLPHLAQDPSFIQMFLDEARLAASLSHPNIVQIYDLGEEAGDYFIAMEYLAGEDLAHVLEASAAQQSPVPIPVAARLVALAAGALHHAHELKDAEQRPRGIVHRDVSPANLLLTYQGTLKVLDFGIAQAQSRSHHTEVGQLKGKAGYMSPEQLRAGPVDRRADVWALGVCLHELLTGRRLFQGSSVAQLALAVCEQPIRPPSAFREGVPSELDAWVLAALHRDLSARLPNAEVLGRGLDEVVRQLGQPVGEAELAAFLERLFGKERGQARMALVHAVEGAPGAVAGSAGPGTAALSERSALHQQPTLMTQGMFGSRPALPVVRRGKSRLLWSVLAAGVLLWGAWGSRRWWAAGRAGPSEALRAAREGAVPAPAGEPGIASPPPVVEQSLQGQASREGTPDASASTSIRPLRDPTDSTLAGGGSPGPRGARTGTLSLSANLRGTAFLGPKNLGRLPLSRVKVPSGQHRIRVVSDEKVIKELSIRVSPGQHAVAEALFRKGKLNITVEPWADVWLDGQPLGQTPLAAREAWEGEHALKLVGPKSQRSLSVRVEGGKTTVVRETLEP
jgi:eukaryotic-like serine/threonine-protein kinase